VSSAAEGCTCSPRWLTKGRGCRADCPALAREESQRLYRVKVRRVTTFYAEIEINATSEREARRLVVEKTNERGAWTDSESKAVTVESVEELGPVEVAP
jgi:hypothetical protein